MTQSAKENSSPTAPFWDPTDLLGQHGRLVLWTVFLFAMLSNAWMVDDAYITFRSIYHWYEGFGLRWNTFERVQSFTHPLWMLFVSAAYGITSEFFYTTLGLSLAFNLAALWVIQRQFVAKQPWKVFALVLLLLASKAFVDFTSSGLENPLTHLLVALFYVRFLLDGRGVRSDAALCTLVAALAFVNRMDLVLLFVPALGYFVYISWQSRDLRVWRSMFVFGLPALAWLAFALLYFGFPLPNTYYAKVAYTGVASAELMRQGVAYFINSLAWDPPTLLLIGVVLVQTMLTRATRPRVAALGVALYLFYVLRVGASGTHMSGRFFSAPYLLAVLILLARPMSARSGFALSGLALLLILFCPMSPLKANTGYYRSGGDGSGWGRNGIIDTRFLVQGHDGSALFNFDCKRAMPNMPWYDEGLQFKASSERVRVGGHGPAIGFFGFAAGPNKSIIDSVGLSDPLLARLPAEPKDWYGGHFFRRVPRGYEESIRSGKNVIEDPDLHAYYEMLSPVTRGPLFDGRRLRAIWQLNFGNANAMLRSYVERASERP